MSSTDDSTYRPLRQSEIQQLVAQGCTARSWNAVSVADPLLPERIVAVDFAGKVRIGSLAGDVQGQDGRSKPAGLYRAVLENCTLGSGVRIANVGELLSGYHIGDGATIENVGRMQTLPGARFGQGAPVAAVNEAGGREVPLFPELSAQFAYLLCLHRYRRELIERLKAMAAAAAASFARDHGVVGKNAQVVGASRIVNVDVGPSAVVEGVQSLVDGVILSHSDDPTVVRNGVIAETFLVAEGAQVADLVVLTTTFVGQACQIGKQFSAENCLFFANCEAFHGEGCSALAGPYTVTHHKSTLLIGGLFSFFNAGSGTNQSNHRYKLGPTHEGKLERGCKTGSSSYLMWPCRVGPFSVVLGKHTRSFDTERLPFSHLEADASGRCMLIPGHYIATVGTLRDGSKWPQRDRRSGPVRRDQIGFDVFSPLTVGRMQQGLEVLDQLQNQTDRKVETVAVGGVAVKRVLLRTGRKRYAASVERYLLEQVVLRLEAWVDRGQPLEQALQPDGEAVDDAQWVDVGGQLMPGARLEQICQDVVDGHLDTVIQLQVAFAEAHRLYPSDVWAWTRTQARATGLVDLDVATPAELAELVLRYGEQQQKFLRLVLVDAQREFDEVSQTGFGIDGDDDARKVDFAAVRGTYEENGFVRQIAAEIDSLPARSERLTRALEEL